MGGHEPIADLDSFRERRASVDARATPDAIADLITAVRQIEARLTALSGSATPVDAPIGPAIVSRFVVHVGERALLVDAQDVDWIEAASNYVRLHVGPEHFRVRSTLSSLASRLSATTFLRIHKSTVVNLSRIKEVQPWFGGDHIAILRDGQQLRVSRTYARALLRPMW